jgi:hypothetical protein
MRMFIIIITPVVLSRVNDHSLVDLIFLCENIFFCLKYQFDN